MWFLWISINFAPKEIVQRYERQTEREDYCLQCFRLGNPPRLMNVGCTLTDRNFVQFDCCRIFIRNAFRSFWDGEMSSWNLSAITYYWGFRNSSVGTSGRIDLGGLGCRVTGTEPAGERPTQVIQESPWAYWWRVAPSTVALGGTTQNYSRPLKLFSIERRCGLTLPNG
jgi:hypothetical protein